MMMALGSAVAVNLLAAAPSAAANAPNFIFVLADGATPPRAAPPQQPPGPALVMCACRSSPSPGSPAGPCLPVRQSDWGYGDTSPYHTLLNHGLDMPATPRLQQMADEGTTYTNFHTLGAECSPSRASWMTGRSPSDQLVRINLVIGSHATNLGKGCGDYVPPSTPTVTSTLHRAGYFTAHFGKVTTPAAQPTCEAMLAQLCSTRSCAVSPAMAVAHWRFEGLQR
jgi:hypothetical protein